MTGNEKLSQTSSITQTQEKTLHQLPELAGIIFHKDQPENKIFGVRTPLTASPLDWALHNRPNWGDLSGSLSKCPEVTPPASRTQSNTGHLIAPRNLRRLDHTITRPTTVPSNCTIGGINPSPGYLWIPYRTSP